MIRQQKSEIQTLTNEIHFTLSFAVQLNSFFCIIIVFYCCLSIHHLRMGEDKTAFRLSFDCSSSHHRGFVTSHTHTVINQPRLEAHSLSTSCNNSSTLHQYERRSISLSQFDSIPQAVDVRAFLTSYFATFALSVCMMGTELLSLNQKTTNEKWVRVELIVAISGSCTCAYIDVMMLVEL